MPNLFLMQQDVRPYLVDLEEIPWGKGGRRWCNHTLCGTDRDEAWAQQSVSTTTPSPTTHTYQAFIIKADTCASPHGKGSTLQEEETEWSSAPVPPSNKVTG